MLRDHSLVPLSHQHHNALVLCVLTDRSSDDPGTLAARAVELFDLQMRNHFELEETLLFAAIRRELGESPLVDELVCEHRELERLVEALRATPSAELLREFTGLLRRHVRKEENELFQDVQKRLPRETLDALGGEFESRAVQVCSTQDSAGGHTG